MAQSPKDKTLKLAKQVAKDPKKSLELLEATTHELAPHVKEKLENKPKFDRAFLEQEAARFGTTVDNIEHVATEVVQQHASATVVEETTFEKEADVRARFNELYETEIRKRGRCRERIQRVEERQRYAKDGSPIGQPERASVWTECGAEYESLQQALVHQSLHLMFDEKDPRTKRAMLIDILELNYPTKEKTTRGAMSVAERRRIMADPRLRARLEDR